MRVCVLNISFVNFAPGNFTFFPVCQPDLLVFRQGVYIYKYISTGAHHDQYYMTYC